MQCRRPSPLPRGGGPHQRQRPPQPPTSPTAWNSVPKRRSISCRSCSVSWSAQKKETGAAGRSAATKKRNLAWRGSHWPVRPAPPGAAGVGGCKRGARRAGAARRFVAGRPPATVSCSAASLPWVRSFHSWSSSCAQGWGGPGLSTGAPVNGGAQGRLAVDACRVMQHAAAQQAGQAWQSQQGRHLLAVLPQLGELAFHKVLVCRKK